MTWSDIIYCLILVGVFVLGLFVKEFLPSYVKRKAENLATKEDIAVITRKTEEVQKDFNEKFEIFSSDVRFKYDFRYKQYADLYCKLYAIIMQSEYMRRFIDLCQGDPKFDFNEAPFVEIQPTERTTHTISFESGKSTQTTKTDIISTPLSELNKKHLCDTIIDNAHLASQTLIKEAMSYRIASYFYSGNKEWQPADSKAGEVGDSEELRLIRNIVMTVVREYNDLRKALRIQYDETELETGIPRI